MKQRYCESPALGIGAPKCSEDCCDYGGCHKQAYFEYIANKYNTTPDKIAIGTNFQFEKFVIEDREYSNEEVLEILKKHKAEEDKKYHEVFDWEYPRQYLDESTQGCGSEGNEYRNSIGLKYTEECVKCEHRHLCFYLLKYAGMITYEGIRIMNHMCEDIMLHPDDYKKKIEKWLGRSI